MCLSEQLQASHVGLRSKPQWNGEYSWPTQHRCVSASLHSRRLRTSDTAHTLGRTWTVVIDGMGPKTIISVSQVCKLGNIIIFDKRKFKVYRADTILYALKVLEFEGKPVTYSMMENGLYYQESD
jgi:hypothetical protein